MKRKILATSALVAVSSLAGAQDLTLSGFVEFEAVYGEAYDLERDWALPPGIGNPYTTHPGVKELDFAVDGNLSFDYRNSTKSGLEYGAHFELDLYQSDSAPDDYGRQLLAFADYFGEDYQGIHDDKLQGDTIDFNDGYVFINSALGNVKLGDTGSAGKAENQLNVPYLVGALEVGEYSGQELEQIFYANAFLGVDFEASVDDDSNWALGIGYGANVGGVQVDLGLSAQDEMMAGSLAASAGGLKFGVNYAMEEAGATTEYVASGVSYAMGPLSIGSGVETEIRHAPVSGEEYESNYFVGAAYELADGLTINIGVANLDSDSADNWSASKPGGLLDPGFGFPRVGGVSGRGLDLGDYESRTWVAGASVKVAF